MYNKLPIIQIHLYPIYKKFLVSSIQWKEKRERKGEIKRIKKENNRQGKQQNYIYILNWRWKTSRQQEQAEID